MYEDQEEWKAHNKTLQFSWMFSLKNNHEIKSPFLTTSKNEKEYSCHVPAIKFIGMKQLV